MGMFQDRVEAGRRLATALRLYTDCPDGLVLAVPRGGVIIGRELSLTLHLPLEVWITRKIGAPGNPELAIGALSETGHLHLNEDLLEASPSFARELEQERARQQLEITRRQQLYRRGRLLPSLKGRTVILADDGVATGATYLASVAALRACGVAKLIAALPVAPAETAARIDSLVDECIVLESPSPFYAVGQHYVDFRQVEDEEVLHSLATSWRPHAQSSGPSSST